MKKVLFPVLILFFSCQLFSQSLPLWIKNTKFKGDFRLREEYKDETGKIERYRTRIRFRLGFITKVNNTLKFGAGFATGSGDPRSTNITLGDSDSKKDFNLDYAFAEYVPFSGLTVWGGKYKGIKNILFRPTDLLWDSDITPEGFGFLYSKDLSENSRFFFNSSYMILAEFKESGADPFVYFVQPGIVFQRGALKIKAAFSFFNTVHCEGSSFDYSSHSNSVDSEGKLLYDYSVLNPSFEVSWKTNFRSIEYLRVFGEYAVNSNVDDEDTGYILGFRFGKKIEKNGDFELTYSYRYLEKDAWLDIFPDSDSFGGKTDLKGSEVEIKVGIAKNVYLSIDYYDMKRVLDEDKTCKLIQFDLNFKF